MEECEKLRGAKGIMLQCTIRQLRKACEVDAPNKRLVAKRVASLEKALDDLFSSHVDLLIKINAQLEGDRFTQLVEAEEEKYMQELDAVADVKAMAKVITGAVEQCKDEFTEKELEEKFSEEVYKQSTTDYMEQCTDEVTNNCIQ